MNDQQRQELIDELIRSQKETDRKFQETDRRFQETDRRFQETERFLKEIGQQTKEKSQETERFLKEIGQQTKEKSQETDRRFQETERFLKEIGQQIGGLNNKFGSFTEGLALPALERALRENFQVETIDARTERHRKGQHLELDILGTVNGKVRRAVIIEVKSRLQAKDLEQLRKILIRFPDFYPEHVDKELIGALAAVEIAPELIPQVHQAGFYLFHIHGEAMELVLPQDAVA